MHMEIYVVSGSSVITGILDDLFHRRMNSGCWDVYALSLDSLLQLAVTANVP
jgi:hypothetical protein